MIQQSGIVHFLRRANSRRVSIERVFSEIRGQLSPPMRIINEYCPFESNTLTNLARNSIWAKNHVGEVNHIVGDVHYLALALPPEKTILTVHDSVLILRNTGLKRLFFWLFWYRLPIGKARIVTTGSEYSKRELIRRVKCKPQKIFVIHHPIFSGFTANSHTFCSDKPIILQIGTGWNKNLSRIIEALKGIRCKLDIVGALNSRQREKLGSNKIDYTEHGTIGDKELIALYKSCDIVLFASIYEGFGLPIIEAQASGRPVVTSNICSMPEVAGNAACFVSPFSVESIREGILRLIDDESYRNTLVDLGYKNIKRYQRETISRRYRDLYNLVNQNMSDSLHLP